MRTPPRRRALPSRRSRWQRLPEHKLRNTSRSLRAAMQAAALTELDQRRDAAVLVQPRRRGARRRVHVTCGAQAGLPCLPCSGAGRGFGPGLAGSPSPFASPGPGVSGRERRGAWRKMERRMESGMESGRAVAVERAAVANGRRTVARPLVWSGSGGVGAGMQLAGDRSREAADYGCARVARRVASGVAAGSGSLARLCALRAGARGPKSHRMLPLSPIRRGQV